MRKLLSALLIATFVLVSGSAYADLQFQNNGTNIGITTKANVKGCTATRTGQIVVIDCTAVTGPVTITGNVVITGTETVTGSSFNNGLSNFLGGINWSSFPGLQSSMGINWNTIIPTITNAGINWNDIILQQNSQGLTTGINWNDISPVAGGVNWMTVIKQASDNTILCAKGGQIGKCSASFSASGAGSCTCI